MVNVLLCQTQLDKEYTNTIDFETKAQQINFFTNRTLNSFVTSNTKVDAFRDTITIDKSYDDTLYFDYLVMRDIQDNLYCYFIDEIEQVTVKTTRLYLTIDVFQTYLFDFSVNQSFVDRCHVPRWNSDGSPTQNNLDEGIEYGHTYIVSRETIKNLTPTYIMCATSPIGLLQQGGGSGDSNSGGGNVSNADVSNDLLRMLKGYEGFAPNPYNLGDGVTTYGYGVTLENEPDFYAKLGNSPCSEQLATEVLIELIQVRYATLVKNQMERDGVDLNSVDINVFDAFVDLCYNTGQYNTPMYKKWLNNPLDETIYSDWLTFIIMEGTQFEEGLRARRKAEADIFKYATYEKRPIRIIGTSDYVEGDGYFPSTDQSVIGEKLVNSARKLIGKPYVWGGNYAPLGNDNGTDCSGLMQWAFNDNGTKISRTTYTQINQGIEIQQKDVKVGDLIFTNFSSATTPEHVFMYSGMAGSDHMCVEAPRTGLNIRERAFTFTESTRIRRLL